MLIHRKWGFGIGSIFSLIVVYFIYLYSNDKGWTLLAFISKWYLIIVGGLIMVSIAVILLIILLSLIVLLIATFRLRYPKKHKKEKSREYIDVEYEVKE
ncbi:hypothetical protein HYW99_03875 [Candidatus Woesearchaeota archaeon]|nr:hypothetical protein [Candidatus Woesearchaeota archaeon]